MTTTPHPKPPCKLTGTTEHVVALTERVRRTLTRAGQDAQAQEMQARLRGCTSYEDALQIFREYVGEP